jgi:hypothetical protein
LHNPAITIALHAEAVKRAAPYLPSGTVSPCGFEQAELFLLGLRAGAPRRAHLNWVLRLHQLEEFGRASGRLPSRSGQGPEERALAAWVRRQRERDGLSVFQRSRLDVSPAFTKSAHDAAWIRRAARVRNMILTTGELPRWLESDPEQYRLREWWNRQLHAVQIGSLDPRGAVIVAELAALPAQITLSRRRAAGGQFRVLAAISTTSAR